MTSYYNELTTGSVYADISQQHVPFEQPDQEISEYADIATVGAAHFMGNMQHSVSGVGANVNDDEELLLHVEYERPSDVMEPRDLVTEDNTEQANDTDTSTSSCGSEPAGEYGEQCDANKYSSTSGTRNGLTASKPMRSRRGGGYANGLCPPAPAVTSDECWNDPADIAEYFPKTAAYKVLAGVRPSAQYLTVQRWVKEKNFYAEKFDRWSDVLNNGGITDPRDRQRINQMLRQLTWLLTYSWDGKDMSTLPPEMLWRARKEELRLVERLMQQKLSIMRGGRSNTSRVKKHIDNIEPTGVSSSGCALAQRPKIKRRQLGAFDQLSMTNGALFKLLVLERQWKVLLDQLVTQNDRNAAADLQGLVEEYVRELRSMIDEIGGDQYAVHDVNLIEDLVNDGYSLQKKLELVGLAHLCSEWFLFKRRTSKNGSRVVKRAHPSTSKAVTVIGVNGPASVTSAPPSIDMKTAIARDKTSSHLGTRRNVASLPSGIQNDVARVPSHSQGDMVPLPSHMQKNMRSVRPGVHDSMKLVSSSAQSSVISAPSASEGNNSAPVSSSVQSNMASIPSELRGNATIIPKTRRTRKKSTKKSGRKTSRSENKFGRLTGKSTVKKAVEASSQSALDVLPLSDSTMVEVISEGNVAASIVGKRGKRGRPKKLDIGEQTRDAEKNNDAVSVRKHGRHKKSKKGGRARKLRGRPRRNTQKSIAPIAASPILESIPENEDAEKAEAHERYDLEDVSEIENRWLNFCLEDERATDEEVARMIGDLLSLCMDYRTLLETPMPRSVAAARRASKRAQIESSIGDLEALLDRPGRWEQNALLALPTTISEASDDKEAILAPPAKRSKPAEGTSLDQSSPWRRGCFASCNDSSAG